MEEKSSSLTIIGILGKSLKTTFKNGNLVLSIILFIFFSISSLELGGYFASEPLLEKLSYKFAKSSTHQHHDLGEVFDESTIKQIKILLLINLGALVFLCASLLFFSIATISSTSAAHTAKTLTLNDMVSWARRKWTAVFKTTIYMSLISIAVFVFYFISLSMGSFLTHGFGSYGLKVGTSILLGTACYIYVSVVWVMSLVVSVVEEKCSGLKAIDKAKEILNGNWIKACVIMILLTVVGIVVYVCHYVTFWKLGTNYWTQFVIDICGIWSLCLVKFFLFVVYTVFYHECKKDENEEDGEGKLGTYLAIASGNDV